MFIIFLHIFTVTLLFNFAYFCEIQGLQINIMHRDQYLTKGSFLLSTRHSALILIEELLVCQKFNLTISLNT